MDRSGWGDFGVESSEANFFYAATLHRFGLPFDYVRLGVETLPGMCACCIAPLWNPAITRSKMDKIFA